MTRAATCIAVTAALIVASCFQPTPHLGQPCTSWCPPPEACVAGACASTEPPPGTDGGGSDAAPVTANYMFVTSTKKFLGDFGGLAGGDAWCNSLAQQAGLPGEYRAWLSDGANSIGAKGRIFETGARGWYRVDGKPFTDQLDDLTSGTLYYPPRVTEQGSDIGSDDDLVATGTFSTGDDLGLNADCEGFTDGSATDVTIAGYADGGAFGWTDFFDQLTCASEMRIYCFGITNQAVVPPPSPPAEPSKLAFITAVTPGSGAAGFDAACSSAAQAAGATGTFAAWIATSTFAPGLPAGPWRRADNVIVMSADLQMLAPIDQKADGTGGAERFAWTGSTAPTQVASASCNDWTNASQGPTGLAGFMERSVLADAWGGSAEACEASAGVYCLQQ